MDSATFAALEAARNYGKDTGAWSGAPTLTTATDWKNTSGGLLMVRVNGGTVTSIKIDGVTVNGLTGTTVSEFIFLRNGSVINITASPMPTCQWFQL